jgi:hypothetical protein
MRDSSSDIPPAYTASRDSSSDADRAPDEEFGVFKGLIVGAPISLVLWFLIYIGVHTHSSNSHEDGDLNARLGRRGWALMPSNSKAIRERLASHSNSGRAWSIRLCTKTIEGRIKMVSRDIVVVALMLSAAALSGCGKSARSVQYYAAHPDEARAVVKSCQTDAARGDDCQNAGMSLDHLDPGTVDAPSHKKY